MFIYNLLGRIVINNMIYLVVNQPWTNTIHLKNYIGAIGFTQRLNVQLQVYYFTCCIFRLIYIYIHCLLFILLYFQKILIVFLEWLLLSMKNRSWIFLIFHFIENYFVNIRDRYTIHLICIISDLYNSKILYLLCKM